MKKNVEKRLSRKQLPSFGVLTHRSFEISKVLDKCRQLDLLNFDNYTDIKLSSNSKHVPFVIKNSYNKMKFFVENEASYLEGDCYRQKYLTDLKKKFQKNIDVGDEEVKSAKIRLKRLRKDSEYYDPISDELNYTERNELVTGIFEEILDSFQSVVTRVRLAYLAPHFSIRPHVDYDTTYIMRYHLPIITNEKCTMNVLRNGKTETVHFPADGRLYFLNAGLKHWAANESELPRLHLIVDVHGQEELASLKKFE